MANFIELRDEPRIFSEEVWIDADTIDAFRVYPDPVPATRELWKPPNDVWIVQFWSRGHVAGCATIYGHDRAKEYALRVIRGEE